ncbi:hypothetical protein SAY86_008671 [Trapa natans]|uniref:C2H2-type domain-containing protein n=1 Tax=Trapa natans TaxID=22666 RepID=A0AAN7QBG6_TRANT|nr:hypothetical protein SAY86_008671 [Trapa natans]
MDSSSASCFQNPPQALRQPYGTTDGGDEGHQQEAIISAAFNPAGAGYGGSSGSMSSTKSGSLLYNIFVLSDKVHQVQSLVTLLISPDQAQPEPASMVAASMGTLIQEIIFVASSMMFTCQQIAGDGSNSSLGRHAASNPHGGGAVLSDHQSSDNHMGGEHARGQSGLYHEKGLNWYTDHQNSDRSVTVTTSTNNIDLVVDIPSTTNPNNKTVELKRNLDMQRVPPRAASGSISGQLVMDPSDCYIIELEAAELLAKYTHYCQICGKGFKRDANLRMHMRAHGDEYKSRSALTNPLKIKRADGEDAGRDQNVDNYQVIDKLRRKYSCPQEGCRWNKRHPKFQPLKSMICVKNHYKRSHCPKMYACKQCNRKHFSVLSDLRTHEKHCMELRWLCSCGTTFSRKDKLMGHVALFVGHSPMRDITKLATGKVEQWDTAGGLHIIGGDGHGNT